MSTARGRWLGAATVLVAAGSIGALAVAQDLPVGIGDNSAVDMSPRQFAPTSKTPGLSEFTKGSDPGRLVSNLLERINVDGSLLSATVAAPTAQQLTIIPPSGDGLWLTIDAAATSDSGPGYALPVWESLTLAGAVRDGLSWASDKPLVGVTVVARNGLKDTIAYNGALGNAAPEQMFTSNDISSADGSIRTHSSQAGLTVQSLRYIPSIQLAPVVKVSVNDAEKWGATHDLRAAIFGSDAAAFEGSYIELDDQISGQPVVVLGTARRSEVDTGWTVPSLRAERVSSE